MASRSMRFWSHSPLALIVLVGAPGALFAACTLNTTGVEAEASTSGASAGPGPGSGSSSGMGGEGGSGGATPPQENCADGEDNDGDMKADCADSDCQPDYECVDPVPSGFTRHVRLLAEGDGGAGGGSVELKCPHETLPVTYFTEPAQSTECSACSCEFKGAACSSPELSCYYQNGGCLANVDYKGDKSTNLDCVGNPGDLSIASSCKLTGEPDLLAKGTCTSSTTEVVGEAWGGTVNICPIEVSGGGCTGGQVCVPKGVGDATSLCIDIAAELDCPESWSTTVFQGYEDVDDTRACSDCGCDVETIKCEDGYYVVYDGDDCSGAKVNIESDACVDTSSYLDGDSGAYRPVPATPSQGTCSGGQPMGKVDATGPHKICCK